MGGHHSTLLYGPEMFFVTFFRTDFFIQFFKNKRVFLEPLAFAEHLISYFLEVYRTLPHAHICYKTI